MSFAIPPYYWPALAAAAPILAPLVAAKYRRYRMAVGVADESNANRLGHAPRLELPVLEQLTLTAIVEERTRADFERAAAVSYLLTTERGKLLFDVGFGPESDVLEHNAARLGISLDDIDALLITHLHLDHMGGMDAQKKNVVAIPEALGKPRPGTPAYLPGPSEAPGFEPHVISLPEVLPLGLATTGPLARGLFFFGLFEEQALVAHLAGKGLVVITGCGHPTIEVILDMTRRLSSEPIYAIAGGLHFPITESRMKMGGIHMQRLVGTGKPPWRGVTDEDLSATIAALNASGAKRILLSAHDSCEHALDRFTNELDAAVEIIEAGGEYRF
jgi:7,8-dihydropterin-6-yl-methyl-4-(beta-D-ribofuranosyl)aminobenzene 5'-phosphate synthase